MDYRDWWRGDLARPERRSTDTWGGDSPEPILGSPPAPAPEDLRPAGRYRHDGAVPAQRVPDRYGDLDDEGLIPSGPYAPTTPGYRTPSRRRGAEPDDADRYVPTWATAVGEPDSAATWGDRIGAAAGSTAGIGTAEPTAGIGTGESTAEARTVRRGRHREREAEPASEDPLSRFTFRSDPRATVDSAGGGSARSGGGRRRRSAEDDDEGLVVTPPVSSGRATVRTVTADGPAEGTSDQPRRRRRAADEPLFDPSDDDRDAKVPDENGRARPGRFIDSKSWNTSAEPPLADAAQIAQWIRTPDPERRRGGASDIDRWWDRTADPEEWARPARERLLDQERPAERERPERRRPGPEAFGRDGFDRRSFDRAGRDTGRDRPDRDPQEAAWDARSTRWERDTDAIPRTPDPDPSRWERDTGTIFAVRDTGTTYAGPARPSWDHDPVSSAPSRQSSGASDRWTRPAETRGWDRFTDTGQWDRFTDTTEWDRDELARIDPDSLEDRYWSDREETFWAGTRLAGDDPRWMDTPVSAPRSPAVAAFPPAETVRDRATSPSRAFRAPEQPAWNTRTATDLRTSWPASSARRAFGSSMASSRRLEEDLLDPNPGGPFLSVLYAAAWYAVPVLVFMVWLLTLDATVPVGCVTDVTGGGCDSERARAMQLVVEAAPRFGTAFASSLVCAVVLRWAGSTWRAGSVGLAAAVVGGGISTVLLSVISGQPIGG